MTTRRDQWISACIRRMQDRARAAGSRHDGLRDLALELFCLARSPDLDTEEQQGIDVPELVRDMALELQLPQARLAAGEVGRLLADAERYAQAKEPVRMPTDLVLERRPPRPSTPATLPRFTGTTWDGVKAPGTGREWSISWEAMARRLREPPDPGDKAKVDLPLLNLCTYRERTEEEARAMKPGAALKSGVHFGPHFRHSSNLVEIHGIGLDLDNAGNATPELLEEVLGGVAFQAHTSYSHQPGAPCWRVFLPLSRPVDRATGQRLIKEWAAKLSSRFTIGPRTDEKGQPKPALDLRPPDNGWFAASARPGYQSVIHPGPALDPDLALAAPAESAATTGYARTDLGNGERLRAAHGQDLIYVPELGWHVWDGRCWVLDESCQVERWMHQVVRAIPTEAEGAGKDEWQRLLKHAAASESTARISAAIESARCYLTKPISALNANHWKLYLENGALDLRTGELLPADRADLCSRISPIRFDPQAKAPRWQQFLEEVVPDPETRAFLQRVAGYCLTGSVEEHCVFLLLGPGRNGKGVFTRALSALLGQAAHAADFSTFLATRNPKDSGAASPDVAALAGRRLVTASEPPEGARWNEAQIKNWAGGDPIYARMLHHDPFTFLPTFKLMFSMNLKPETKDLSYAFWERIRLIEFNTTITEEKRDRRLDEKLRLELPGILNWALQGCLRWQEIGLGTSRAVAAATASYRGEQDPSEQFLSEVCSRSNPDARTTNAELWYAWNKWVTGRDDRPRSQKWLAGRLTAAGFQQFRTKDTRGWCLEILDSAVTGDASVTEKGRSPGFMSSENSIRGNPGEWQKPVTDLSPVTRQGALTLGTKKGEKPS